MLLIFRLILWLTDATRPSRADLTDVTKAIELITGSKKKRSITGGILFLVPVISGLVLLYFSKNKFIYRQGFMYLCVAALWGFIGPIAIWRFEKEFVPHFLRGCKGVGLRMRDRHTLRRILRAEIVHDQLHRSITYGWMIIVMTSYLLSLPALVSFGIYNIKDPFFWIIGIGVALYAYYTSLGFRFVFASFKAISFLCDRAQVANLFEDDQMLGFGFAGKFCYQTAVSFLSGLLFIPLIYFIDYQSGGSHSYFISIMLAAYSTFIALLLFLLLAPLHTRMLNEKAVLNFRYGKLANNALNEIETRWDQSEAERLKIFLSCLSEARNIKTWPIQIEALFRFVAQTITIPIIIGLFIEFAKANLH